MLACLWPASDEMVEERYLRVQDYRELQAAVQLDQQATLAPELMVFEHKYGRLASELADMSACT